MNRVAVMHYRFGCWRDGSLCRDYPRWSRETVVKLVTRIRAGRPATDAALDHCVFTLGDTFPY